MRKLLFLVVTAVLVLPGNAWIQSAAQGQQSANTPADKPQSSQKGQAPGGTSSAAQSASAVGAPQDPVAAAARRTKEQKKSAPKSTKVFTNDDIPSSGEISAAGEDAASTEPTPGSEASAKPAANDEKAWRDKFAALRRKLDNDQQELAVMQRELSVLNLQYYPDPVKAMQQQYTRSDINDKTAKIDAKKKEIDADQQAISDAEDDLRKAGGQPGWAR
jgi:hypothetical protein